MIGIYSPHHTKANRQQKPDDQAAKAQPPSPKDSAGAAFAKRTSFPHRSARADHMCGEANQTSQVEPSSLQVLPYKAPNAIRDQTLLIDVNGNSDYQEDLLPLVRQTNES